MTTEREIEMMGADCYTVLALELDAAMQRSYEARDAYARIYGVAWAPLHSVDVSSVKSHAVSTTLATVR